MPFPASTPLRCSVLLLAGGRGQRMGGQDKGLLEWRGRPLVAWLYELVRPLGDDLILSCNRNAERYRPYADRLVDDGDDAYQGPLAGIRAGLAAARCANLLVLPCDAPRLDRPLLDALLARAGEGPAAISCGGQLEPLFSVWPKSLLAPLERAWHSGERSPQRLLRQWQAATLECAADDPRLANLNTPQSLAEPEAHGPGT
ncbi:molybdenum cofactor guanylyltransferase MobA [Pseudomonas sp. RIT-PI-AD]|uniref:molybdenum cofactor guanylyltransferase MobA n=1 Tax=Pseudomonas sp. RIT-PI-AD TaxID=3035294 RepID=UPI0021D81611|nr:molybdenum cofactor guanylyltransferase MobA [Pseudomonas sp. RIT-PI-AD]